MAPIYSLKELRPERRGSAGDRDGLSVVGAVSRAAITPAQHPEPGR
jgi:hypothetical protein